MQLKEYQFEVGGIKEAEPATYPYLTVEFDRTDLSTLLERFRLLLDAGADKVDLKYTVHPNGKITAKTTVTYGEPDAA